MWSSWCTLWRSCAMCGRAVHCVVRQSTVWQDGVLCVRSVCYFLGCCTVL